MQSTHDSIIVPDIAENLPELYVATFPAVAGFVAKMGGTLDDARDIFHDALITFLEKQGSVHVEHSPEAYIVGIAKHLWLRQRKRGHKLVALDAFESSLIVPEPERPPLPARLLALLERSGQTCLELLQAYYYEKLTPQKIAARFGFANTHSAAVRKHKCLQKVRTTIESKSLHHGDFTE